MGQNLLDRGCSHLVVVHDLDKRDETTLRTELEAKIKNLRFSQKLVLIPIEEIEAWLLCDAKAIKTVFSMQKQPKVPRSPEAISDPKEFLTDLVRKNSNSQYLNTVHNRRIANAQSIVSCKRCRSFIKYSEFLKTVFPRAKSRVI